MRWLQLSSRRFFESYTGISRVRIRNGTRSRPAGGDLYAWDETSDYIQEPPFFDDFSMEVEDIHDILNARPLGIFGDSVTTDHISPAGAIKQTFTGRTIPDRSGGQADRLQQLRQPTG